ncbi:hypothetical protein S40285_03411 [Stachybotrys chlorohalonatus IBT 40285]|uniref:Phosphogluconate dehydrogenase NAD-binding putative C-terminal domain-containing protein n=1 Tax=Stachybotrys chlorohalonatus (strain IBT 40285) TaxID=1283841 RepID=A0A084QBX2_STAC4|nr:hypothetical protein S40285_03411 [Stachybotrys chlorohalonata IBT 40285]
MAPSSNSPTRVGVLSMGDMGSGIARLLMAHGFRVATNCSGRSEDTAERARQAGVQLSSDLELVQQCHVILSVVPPSQADAIARRIVEALSRHQREDYLYFADLNAVSPSTVRSIASRFDDGSLKVRFIDGCILGGPPRLKAAPDPGTNASASDGSHGEWSRPRIPVSGPSILSSLADGDKLASTLNMRTISPDIGPASGLKMCFAALSKGFTALATQSFTTAQQLGVADELSRELRQVLPQHLALVDRSVAAMPPKAYRWVREMEEIATTMSEDGGWTRNLFDGAAGVYRVVAEDEVLGSERIGKRKRGTTAEDVAAALAEGLKKKRGSA